MAARKAHVIEQRWQTGAFHVERHIRCRCGATFTHYNAQEVTRQFREHVGVADIPEGQK